MERARRDQPRCHDADVVHSVRARKSLPASLLTISPHATKPSTIITRAIRWNGSIVFVQWRRFQFVYLFGQCEPAVLTVRRAVQPCGVVRKRVTSERPADPIICWFGRGCSDGMWRVVMVTWWCCAWAYLVRSLLPPERGSSTGAMRGKRWARMPRAW